MALGVFHNKTRDQLKLGGTGQPTLLKPNIPDSVLSLSIKVFTMLWIPYPKQSQIHPSTEWFYTSTNAGSCVKKGFDTEDTMESFIKK